MIVNIEVTNIHSRILQPLDEVILNALEKELSFEVKGSFFSNLRQQGFWDGRTKLFSIKTRVFPTGLLPRAREVLTRHNIEIDYIDKRDMCPLGKELPLYMEEGDELYNYQKNSIAIALSKTRGVIKLPTGGGKSVVIAGIVAKINLPTLILIHRKDILHQLKDMLEFHLRTKIGIIGCGKTDIQQINIGMIGTLAKSKKVEVQEVMANTRCLIVDEAHILPAKQAYNITKMCGKAFLRFGDTATPFRYDNKDLYIEAPTGEKIVNISVSDLIKEGYLVTPHIFVVGVSKKPQLSSMTYQEIYDQGIVNNEERNTMIVDMCNYLNSKGKIILIAVTRVEHGKILISDLHERFPHIKSIFVHGEDEDFLRKEVLDDLRNRKLDVVIATSIYREGVNIPTLDVLINAKCQDSGVDSYQLIGRVLRKAKDKKYAIVVDFNDKSKYLHKHGIHRKDIYEQEPEFKLYNCKDENDFVNQCETMIEIEDSKDSC